MCLNIKTRASARSTAAWFAVFTLVFLSVEMAGMVFAASYCEAQRRRYIWLTWGYRVLWRIGVLGLIATWMFSAGRDNARLMNMCSTVLGARAVGMTLYALVNAYQLGNKDMNTPAEDLVLAPLHDEEAISSVTWKFNLVSSAMEGWFLCGLTSYEEALDERPLKANSGHQGGGGVPKKPVEESIEDVLG
ncbi:uncharacterized protein LOC144145259 [Haemaphysalis longicornis]